MASPSFILKVSVFSKAYLDPSRTFMMKLFTKIAEAVNYFCKESSIIRSSISNFAFTKSLRTARFFKVLYLRYLLGVRFGKKYYALKKYFENLTKKAILLLNKSLEPYKLKKVSFLWSNTRDVHVKFNITLHHYINYFFKPILIFAADINYYLDLISTNYVS